MDETDARRATYAEAQDQGWHRAGTVRWLRVPDRVRLKDFRGFVPDKRIGGVALKVSTSSAQSESVKPVHHSASTIP
jgi:hypothetical protein